MFFKFINKSQREILRCAPPSSHVCDFFQYGLLIYVMCKSECIHWLKLWTCSLRWATKLLFQGPSWSEWCIFPVFFFVYYLLFLKNVPRLKIKLHNIQSWMSKWIFKVVENCARKIVKRTHLLLNSKMVKSFLGRSNSNFGSKQLTSMVDMPCRIIIGKFQPLKVLGS